jgi:L,D-transpeptidase YcbB
MRRGNLVAALLCAWQALPLTAILSADSVDAASSVPAASHADQQPPAVGIAPPASTADPVIELLRLKLGDPGVRSRANPEDLAALEAFYTARGGGPLWMTDMGFTAKGQQALFEIAKADDWGLDAAVFDLPPAGDLPAGAEAQATAEIKLDLAILKYARFARGGRLNPSKLSRLFDQAPPLRDPKIVFMEIAAAKAPDTYLRSLHPNHEQFVQLREALLKAQGKDQENTKPRATERDIKRLIINMERWRWMPEELGELYVWSNTPDFMLYVVKEGKTIYADKTQIGTFRDPTPVFSANITALVFNPEWIAPRSVLVKGLLPRLRKKNYSILDKYAFSVSYRGEPVNPTRIDWGRVNILDYTFTQKPGPNSNLGKIKFLLPNKHNVLLHDTFPARRKIFRRAMRAIGYGCVRMEKPDRLAELLLAEANGWAANAVKDLWDNGVNRPVALNQKVPVHITYFTALADETGKVATSEDLYGLDRKLASALFGNASDFPPPSSETTTRENEAPDFESSSPESTDKEWRRAEEIVGASWYGNEFRGSRTASGENFNPDGLTAAHKSLAFGTCLVVGNPKTGKEVTVRVNDRGPFVEGRTLDLSAGAARSIGMRSTQKVSMKRCEPADKIRSIAASASD